MAIKDKTRLNIVYLMPESYPFGKAYASRVRGFSKSLINKGHNVVVFCDYPSDKSYQYAGREGVYEGQHFFYTAEKRTKSDRFSIGRRTVDHFLEYLNNNHIDIVITSSAYDRVAYLNRKMEGRKIPLVLESCEKYHYSNWRFGRLDYRFFQFSHCWNKEYPKADAVIAISRYLTDYYERLGKHVLRVPTILDTENIMYSTTNSDDNIINFVFAGTLGGGKDSVSEFIKAMSMIDSHQRERIKLHIYGPTEEQVLDQLREIGGMPRNVAGNVKIYGRVPQGEIPHIISSKDYSLLLRPIRESSEAGFPTKLAESMASGTPVFGNITGDVGLYLKHGVNGIIVENDNPADIKVGLKTVLSLTKSEREEMRVQARNTAEKEFNYISYSDSIEEFLIKIIGGGYRETELIIIFFIKYQINGKSHNPQIGILNTVQHEKCYSPNCVCETVFSIEAA